MSAALKLEHEALLERAVDRWRDKWWRAGDLSWKLDPHQLRVYKQYRAWEARVTQRGIPRRGLHRIFVMDISRRWGKTFLVALIMIEDCLRNRGMMKTYATAHMKDMLELVIPMIDEIIADAPEDLCPVFAKSILGATPGYRFPSTRSILKLVGIDKNPKGLRGKASDGFAITEAGHVPKLAYTIGNVVYPQFQRRKHALMILESNAPEDLHHDYDRIFVPDAVKRGAFVQKTIDDNQAISDEEKAEFIEASNTVDPSGRTARREYYQMRERDPSVIVIPEFNPTLHVVDSVEVPDYAYCYVGMDPGEQPDPLGLVFGYVDWERAKLVIVRSFAEQNFRTGAAAEYIREVESEEWCEPLFHGPPELHPKRFKLKMHDVKGWAFEPPEGVLTYWDGSQFKPNPYMRVSDSEHRIVNDLAIEHGVVFSITEKGDKIAARNRLRGAFSAGRIEILRDSGPLAEQLEFGRYKLDADKRPTTDYDRTKTLGHLDCIDALLYMFRNIDFSLNPSPPRVTDKKASNIASHPWHSDVQPTGVSAKLREAFGGRQPGYGGRQRWKPNRTRR